MMHPILSHLRRLLWYVFALLGAGILLSWLLVQTHLALWPGALLFALPVLQLYGFILTSAYYVCRSLPFQERTPVRVLGIFLGASLLSALAWLGLSLLWNNMIGDMEVARGGVQVNRSLSVIFFASASVMYLISLLIHDVFIAFDNMRAAERRQLASQLLARDAELQMLRSQINPHFLFNSLNSISALTSIDAAAARSMAIELGSFYRKTLATSERQLISLSEELELCEHFLAIEKIRFGEKLKTNLAIETESLAAQVPAMFLQPLLENAIKHGICNISDGGVITIKSHIRDSWLHIVINNPVDLDPSITKGTATGLKNLKARMHNLYQEKARISWQESSGHFCVEIIMPLEFALAGSENE